MSSNLRPIPSLAGYFMDLAGRVFLDDAGTMTFINVDGDGSFNVETDDGTTRYTVKELFAVTFPEETSTSLDILTLPLPRVDRSRSHPDAIA